MSVDVTLRLPTELGASVVSRAVVRERLAESGLAIRSESRPLEDSAALRDFGAVFIALAGTAAASAAAKGLFDVLKTVVSEAYSTRRARFAEEARFRRLELLLGQRSEVIDLDATLEDILARLDVLEAELERSLTPA
jgi:hypothetical protein